MPLWLTGILSILRPLFSSLSIWLEQRSRDSDKEAGRNEEKLENVNTIQRRKSRARDIINRVRNKRSDSDK